MRRNASKDSAMRAHGIYKKALEQIGDILDSADFGYDYALKKAKEKGTVHVVDDSIPNAFKKLRSALRERARTYNKFINEHHGRLTIYTPGIYKTRVIRVWNQALEIADLAVRDAIKELERLT